MINDKSAQIERLRRICEDPTTLPSKRRRKTLELLAKFKPTKNTVKPIVLNVIRSFEHFQDANLERQREVRAMAEEIERALKAKIKACESEDLDSGADAETDAPTATAPPDQPVPSIEISSNAGIELLPPDRDDDFWDGAAYGKSRRSIVSTSFGLSASVSRAQAVATIAARLKVPESEIEFRPGRDDPPFSNSWIPVARVRGKAPFDYTTL